MSSDAKTAANAGRVSPQGVTRRDGDGLSPLDVGLRCANPAYGKGYGYFLKVSVSTSISALAATDS